MKKRVLFLLSDTGGGHRAAAQAIAEAMDYLYPNRCEFVIEDIWRKNTPWPINQIPNLYPWLTGSGQFFWKLLWSSSTHLPIHETLIPLLTLLLERKVVRYFKTTKPDIVVSVHPFMNHLGLRLLGKVNPDIPFVTIVTDMVTVHPLWVCPHVTHCFVSTETACQSAIKLGMPPEKVEVCGQPVGLKFAAMRADKRSVRQQLGLDSNRFTVMIMGGGEGTGRVFEIARTIAQIVPHAQLVIVAGRNKALQKKLEQVTWEIPTQIFGFADNIPELMQTADILITKAGPGTLSEAFIAGLPLLISGYIPGHEQSNMAYVQAHQAGVYAQSSQDIANLILSWTTPNNNTLQQMTHNAAKLARPKASLAIAAKVCDLIRGKLEKQD